MCDKNEELLSKIIALEDDVDQLSQIRLDLSYELGTLQHNVEQLTNLNNKMRQALIEALVPIAALLIAERDSELLAPTTVEGLKIAHEYIMNALKSERDAKS